MADGECGFVQLPSQREGYVELYSSTEAQAVREAEAVGLLSPRYVRELLERRAREEDERARKRRAERLRWKGVAEQRIAPMTIEQVTALHSDLPDEGVGSAGSGARSKRRQKAAAAEAVGLDRLLDSVNAQADLAESA